MLKLLVEFGPIIVFFATYKFSNIFTATLIMLIVTLLGLILSYIIDRKISMPLLISGSILLTSGSVTMISGDPSYIKMKPTIVNLAFGSILVYGIMRGQGFMKYVFAAAIKLSDQNWIVLSKRFALYFFTIALVNEFVWRNFSESFWVDFKVFGFVPLTLLFVLSQTPFIYKKQSKTD